MKKSRRSNISKIFTPQKIYTGALCVIVIAFLFLFGKLFPAKPPVPQSEKIVPAVYTQLSLQAKSAYVLDAKTGKEIYSFNGETQLPLASLTKVMMAVTSLSLLPENTIITIKPEFLTAEGDSGLFGNERWRLKDLLNLTLIESSNDGANAIAYTAGKQAAAVALSGSGNNSPYNLEQAQFVAEMNRKSQELGLTQTYFLNPNGLDENTYISGGYGSAHDISKLFSYAISKYPKLFEGTRYNSHEFNSLSSLKHLVKNTNTVVDKLPSLLASKTGYTDLAGGNLTIAFDAGPGKPIIISVLGSTEQGRFDDTEKLLWATIDYLNKN